MPILIEKVTRFRVGDREFQSPEKAIDFIEDQVNRKLQALLIEKGFSASECLKITLSILEKRHEFADLLGYEFDFDKDAL
jgi:hypothetical protein